MATTETTTFEALPASGARGVNYLGDARITLPLIPNTPAERAAAARLVEDYAHRTGTPAGDLLAMLDLDPSEHDPAATMWRAMAISAGLERGVTAK